MFKMVAPVILVASFFVALSSTPISAQCPTPNYSSSQLPSTECQYTDLDYPRQEEPKQEKPKSAYVRNPAAYLFVVTTAIGAIGYLLVRWTPPSPFRKFLFWRRVQGIVVVLTTSFILGPISLITAPPIDDPTGPLDDWFLTLLAAIILAAVWRHTNNLRQRAARTYGKDKLYPRRDGYATGRAARLVLWTSVPLLPVLFTDRLNPSLWLVVIFAAVVVTIKVRLDRNQSSSYKLEQALRRQELLQQLTGKTIPQQPVKHEEPSHHAAPERHQPAPNHAEPAASVERHQAVQPVPLTYETLEPALLKLLEKAQADEERRNIRQEIIFLIVGVLLAFIVNWSSEPLLQGIQGIFN